MSATWRFSAVDHPALARLFGGGSPGQAKALAELLADESYFEFEDPGLARRVARRAVRSGISFDDAGDEEAEVLDVLVPAALIAFREELVLEPLSPLGLTIRAVEELWRRAEGRRDAPWVGLLRSGGRRFGRAEAEWCESLVLAPDEVEAALDEARAIVALNVPWSHPEFPALVEAEWIGPLRRAAEIGRGMTGSYP